MAEVMRAQNIPGGDLDTAMTDQDTLAAFHHDSHPTTSFFNTSTWDWDAVEQTLQVGEEAAYHISSHHDGDHHDEGQRVDTPPQNRVSNLEVIQPQPLAERDDKTADAAEHKQGLDEEDYELPRRELRSHPRGKRTFATTWIDNDDTGNYDPEEEKRKERLKRAKVRAFNQQRLHRESAEQASDDEMSDDLTEELTSEATVRARLVVPLTFLSQAGKAALIELLGKLAAQEHSEKAGYKLRKRSRHVAHYPGSAQDGIDGVSTEIDLTAKPFARGCWACTTTGTCSLLHDERTWPCQTCFEDDMDCEPIVPPVRKRACETCKRRKMSCSYTYTRKHGPSCEQCERVGQRCVAGPVKEFIRPRISYDRDWEADPLPKRRGGKQKELEDCLECVGGRRSCSYPAGSYGSPCEECIHRGLPCSIAGSAPAESASPAEDADPANELITDSTKEASDKETKPDIRSSGEASRNQGEPPDRTTASDRQLQRPKGTIRKIYTSFPHPIVFNCDLEGDKDSPCYFCTEPALSKLGFGLMHPEVEDWSDGRGFIEVNGGHIQINSIQKTRLCYSCTSSRLAIVTCYRHRMRRIASQADRRYVHEQSCHVCTGSATYECTPSDKDTVGCGLEMCHPCAVSLSRDYGGYLGKMLGTLADEPKDAESRTLRADGEFLKEDGHVARYLNSLDT